MRRNFAQILKDAKIDIKKEYQKLYNMLYEPSIQIEDGQDESVSVYDLLEDNFTDFYFRGTCLSLDEFNDLYGFHFQKDPQNFNIDYLVSLCEYIENMLIGYQGTRCFSGVGYIPMLQPENDIQFFMMQIDRIIERIGYIRSNQDNFVIFVEKSPAAISVAESNLIPKDLSYKLISYNHHTMKGNLQEKKNTILQLADLLEAKRSQLSEIDSIFSSDLFYLFNNLNLRHNNIDPSMKGKFKKAVADMELEKLEHWYDETYQMCLLAFLRLEHIARKKAFDTLKSEIENTSI